MKSEFLNFNILSLLILTFEQRYVTIIHIFWSNKERGVIPQKNLLGTPSKTTYSNMRCSKNHKQQSSLLSFLL